MYSKLYEVFHHWYYGNSVSGGEIYFYSDPHFSDEEMKYLRKNYIGDEEQVKRINSKVTKSIMLLLFLVMLEKWTGLKNFVAIKYW